MQFYSDMTVNELSSLKKPFCHSRKSPIYSLDKKAITLHRAHRSRALILKSRGRTVGHRAVTWEHCKTVVSDWDSDRDRLGTWDLGFSRRALFCLSSFGIRSQSRLLRNVGTLYTNVWQCVSSRQQLS